MADKKKAPKPRKLVVIEESTITGMATNKTFLKEFPFLGTLAKQLKTKTCCGRAAKARTDVFSGIKQAFAGLDSTKKRRLRELLNADHVQVTYKNSSGKFIQLTIQ